MFGSRVKHTKSNQDMCADDVQALDLYWRKAHGIDPPEIADWKWV
jgi:hypothetical protein